MKYSLDTDFATLNGPKASNWLNNFQDMIENAFADRDNRSRLLGNLLVMELCTNTLRQGLDAEGEPFPTVIQRSMDLLWDCLNGRTEPADFQEYANNLYACILEHDVGEEVTDVQAAFYKEHFSDTEGSTYEWGIYDRIGVLLMEWTAICGGQLDFEEFESCQKVDFTGISEWLDFFSDVCIDLTETPCPSDRAKDVLQAMELVYQTPLFRQIVSQIQSALNTALTATPEQYEVLRTEYRSRSILPEKYAPDLLSF